MRRREGVGQVKGKLSHKAMAHGCALCTQQSNMHPTLPESERPKVKQVRIVLMGAGACATLSLSKTLPYEQLRMIIAKHSPGTLDLHLLWTHASFKIEL